MTRDKLYKATWPILSNKNNGSLYAKKDVIKNEITISAMEEDLVKNEIIINAIEDESVKNEITLNAIENDLIKNEVTLNISEDVIKNEITFGGITSDSSIKENVSSEHNSYKCTDAITLISNPPSLLDEHLVSKDKERIILSSDPLTEMNEILSLEESSENVACTTYVNFQERIANYEVDTYTKYVILKTRGSFTSNDGLVLPKRIHWWNGGNLHGVPYVIVATRYLSCRFGAPTHAKVLEKYNREREEKHQLGLCKRYKKAHGSTKLGCPVKIIANRLLIFPDFQGYDIPATGRHEKDEIRQKILRSFKELRYENRYTCVLPDIEDHKFHGPSSSEKEPMDKRILQRIKMFVNMGKTDPDDILEALENFAQVELNVKDRNRRRFYPSRVDVIHTVNRSRSKIRCSEEEQERLNSMKHAWGDESELFIRPMRIGDINADSSTFLLVYQSKEMKRLFRLYGNNAVFVDAVHRTCEYVWPLFFVVVNTNINYQVVAFFITQHESKYIIAEALKLIKSWNPEVNPKYGIVNRPWEEVKGMELAYPDIQIFLSSYHRNQAWEKKVSRRDNRNMDQGDILKKLRAVADAVTEDQLNTANINLKESDSYNSCSIKYYYENFWQHHLKRWAAVYWPTDLYFEINNGIQRLSTDLNYDYLVHIKRENLSSIIDLLIKNYLPKNLDFYKRKNLQTNDDSSCSIGSHPEFREYSSWVADYLLSLHYKASQISSQSLVQKKAENRYLVSLVYQNGSHEVCIAPYANIATCTCPELNRTNFICKHIIIVGLKFPELHISKISGWLFREPIFHLDDYFFEELIEELVHQNEDFSMGSIVDVPEKETQFVNRFNKQNHLQSKCVMELKSLESMVTLCSEDHLQELFRKLKDLREKHTQLLRSQSATDFRQDKMMIRSDRDEISDSFMEDDDMW